jgi:hypothetical protein
MHNVGLTQDEQEEVRKIDLFKDNKRAEALKSWEKKTGKKFPRSVCHGPKLCPAMQEKEDETFRALFPFSAPLRKRESAW